jgi:hypothetical protein
MIHIPVKQGSPEWLLQRYGIPTASGAHNIITASKGDKSTSWDKYISELIAERHAKNTIEQDVKRFGISDPDLTVVVGNIEKILNRTKTEGMAYGTEMEPEAGRAYTFLTDNELTEAGFMLNDERTAGASLDRLIVGQKKGLEIKSPFSLNVHIGYCLSRNIEIDKRPQLQWQLWISELEEIDICAYYPGTVAVIVNVKRDEEYIAKIKEFHADFWKKLEERWGDWQNLQPKQKEEKINLLKY